MQVVLDARKLDEKEQAHDYLKEMLELPDYYGKNLDALYDCLTELNKLDIEIVHIEDAKAYYPKVRKILFLAMEDNTELHIMEKSEPV